MREHLKRFMWLARRNMPDASYYLLVPTWDGEDVQHLVGLGKYFKRIVQVERRQLQGNPLLYFDVLRLRALNILGLSEALYVDPDADIMQDMSHIPSLSSAKIMYVQHASPTPEAQSVLNKYGVGMGNKPFGIENGMIYLRDVFNRQFAEILYSGNIDVMHSLAGIIAWQVLVRQQADSFALSENYDAPWWHEEYWAHAYAIHFHGQGKRVRPYYDWKDWPRSWKRNDKPVEMDITWI